MVAFANEDLSLARNFSVGAVHFSGGTYQVEVDSVWPFLQLDDQGKILDAFCTCEKAATNTSCPHLAAAYLNIMGEESLPLHVRFRESFWNHLGLLAFERLGSDISSIKQETKNTYTAAASTGRKLFVLKPLTNEATLFFRSLFFMRPIETEETSLKFSKLSPEEIALWKQGKPSRELRYELSFWSDLAKYWMSLQEKKDSYQIVFEPENELPHMLKVRFFDHEFYYYIATVDWPQLIPALSSVHSPLSVHPLRSGHIKAIYYSKEKKSFHLQLEKRKETEALFPEKEGIPIDQWFYLPGEGFYPRIADPFLEMTEIPQEKISSFLSHHQKLVAKHLTTDVIHFGSIEPNYHLSIDEKKALVIRCYLFTVGDLHQEGAECFGRWAYLPNLGFFHLEEGLFVGKEQIIPKQRVGAFVSSHRVWLQNYEGFQPHVSTVQSHLGYRLNKELEFFLRIELTEDADLISDFGEWIHVQGKGFYARASEQFGNAAKGGLKIPAFQISAFIDKHKEELEGVSHFFSPVCPLEKAGLEITLSPTNEIQVIPKLLFSTEKKVLLFDHYTYVEGEGFALIPPEKRLPENYSMPKTIDQQNEPYFVGYELDLLYPFIIQIDPRLKKPKECVLHLDRIKYNPEAKTGQWILSLRYETNLGSVFPFTLWETLHQKRSYFFSEAGLLFINHFRFDWLKGVKKKRWLSKGKELRISTLEFLQLHALEELTPPPEKKGFSLYQKFLSFEPPEAIDLTGLQSSLRPYQQVGVNWLWFLASYGLSGLLCDEMGLGKTHQAMALIAGLKNAHQDRPLHILVVCPTSVIYHWEQLLLRFFPSIRMHLFYGPQRSLPTDNPLLLTSYGTLRSDKKLFQTLSFDLAIFDEIQIAKNDKSQVNQALHVINARMRLGLTGTPIENRLLELKTLFDLVLPGYLPSASQFKSLFINPIERQGNNQKSALLKRLIKPFILRRKKSEVLEELPEKIEEIAYCDLSLEQQKLYREIFYSYEKPILESLHNPRMPFPVSSIFTLLIKLKQICDHPCLITKDVANYLAHSSGKWDLFIELLSEIRDSGQKVVIFSQYLDMLNILELYLQNQKIQFATIRGSTKDRKEQVAKFQTDPNCEVFLGSLQAAGVGIDLVAASVVIHYDRWWNPAKENQATDRVHRMGQSRGVQVFKLVTRHSVEEHIHRLIESKLALTSAVIDFDQADQMKQLSREELISLMQQLRKDVQNVR